MNKINKQMNEYCVGDNHKNLENKNLSMQLTKLDDFKFKRNFYQLILNSIPD